MVEELKRSVISDMSALQGIILTWMEFDADKTESRWSEIRDGVLTALSLPLKNDELNRFNMRLSRALQRLVKEEIIVKTNMGHKYTAYSLKEPLTSSMEDVIPGGFRFPSSLRWYEVVLPNEIALFKIAKQSNDYKDFKEKILTVISDKIEKELKEKWGQIQEDKWFTHGGHQFSSLWDAESLTAFFEYASGNPSPIFEYDEKGKVRPLVEV